MIKVHHLNNSRSQRVIWALEELGLDYEVVRYQRDPITRLAPPELKAEHRLGKSPLLTDGDLTIAESAAIVEYLIRTYGHGRLAPAAGTRDDWAYLQWMHFAEGSAMLPLLLKLYVGRLGDAGAPLWPRIDSETANHLGYMEAALAGREFFVGSSLTGADIMLSFVVEIAQARGGLDAYPNLAAYAARIHARTAYQRALERGGPYEIGR